MLYEMNMSYLEFYNTCRNMYKTEEFLGFKLKLKQHNCYDISKQGNWEQPQDNFVVLWSVLTYWNNEWCEFPGFNRFSKTSVAFAQIIPYLIYMCCSEQDDEIKTVDFNEYFKDKKDSVEEYYEQYKEIMAKLKLKE